MPCETTQRLKALEAAVETLRGDLRVNSRADNAAIEQVAENMMAHMGDMQAQIEDLREYARGLETAVFVVFEKMHELASFPDDVSESQAVVLEDELRALLELAIAQMRHSSGFLDESEYDEGGEGS